MEDFSFERLRSSQSSRREKNNWKDVKARVKLFFFFRKSGKILHSKQYVNHLIDWAVNGHSVGSSWIYSLFLSSNMYWWRTIYSWVVCLFYSGMRTHSSFFSALSSENYKKRELKSESWLPNSNEFIKTVSPILNLGIFVNNFLLGFLF